MELLKQATNSISKCKLIPRSLCGEGISMGSPVNMCTVGSKVTWPTGGVISHSLITHPRCSQCCGVEESLPGWPEQCVVSLLSLCHVSAAEPLWLCVSKSDSHDVSVVGAKNNSQCLHPAFFLILTQVLHLFSASLRELGLSNTNILPWRRCRNGVKFPDA